MENQNSAFWCNKCSKKYFLQKESLLFVPKSSVQKKLPFLDPENNNKTKSEMKSSEAMYKCKVCGFTMKEVTEQQSAEANYDS